jgi:hypothetical protein
MTHQSRRSGNAAAAVTPLRILAELGDVGIFRVVGTDLNLWSPCLVNPGWYERHWYGYRSPSKWGILVDTARRLCREVPRAAGSVRDLRRIRSRFDHAENRCDLDQSVRHITARAG